MSLQLPTEWWRVESVPTAVGTGDDPVPGMVAQLRPAVRAAHAHLGGHDGSAMGSLWLRAPGERSMSFHVGGRPAFPPASGVGADTVVPVVYPPGATASAAPAEDVEAQLAAFPCWLRVMGGADVLWQEATTGHRTQGSRSSTLEDFVAHLPGPFAWLVVATPVTPDEVEEERGRTALKLREHRKQEGSESHRVQVERAEFTFRELTRSRVGGLWSVHILAGAPDAGTARAAAALLSGCDDVRDAGYVTVADGEVRDLAETLAAVQTHGPDGVTAPFRAGSDLVASLVRPPAVEIPGIRATRPYAFDVTPEVSGGAGDGVRVGSVIDSALRPVADFVVSRSTLNRHGFICGATGSGKSQTSRGLLESLSRSAPRVPWLVIEPAKAEYARMAGRLPADAPVTVIRPGDLGSAPAGINPLEPEPGYPLQSHADLVRALFMAAFEADEPFPQVLSQALDETYRSAGWDLVTSAQTHVVDVGRPAPELPRSRSYPTLGDLQSASRRVVDAIGYGREVADNIRGFVDVRIGSLRTGTPGRFFEGGHPIDIGDLLRRNVVLELDPITNDQDKAFLMGAVLIRIVEHLRVRHRDADADSLRHVILIEEAHRLLKNVHDGPAGAAVELFASLLAEIRSYGEGVVVVEQIPSKLLPDVIKNTAFKVVHRLPALDDRQAVGSTMNLGEEQSEVVVSLPPGVAAVSVDGSDRPFAVRMDAPDDRETVTGSVGSLPLRGDQRRSRLCGGDCWGSACTLQQMRSAEVTSQRAATVVWVEACTAALLMGLTPPAPSAAARVDWSGERSRDCTLAYLVDRAVGARRAVLRPWLDLDAFAEALRATLLAHGDPDSAGVVPSQWAVGSFRWEEVHGLFKNHFTTIGGAAEAAQWQAADDITAWESRGLDLGGETLADQYAAFSVHPSFAVPGTALVFGDRTASGLDVAVRSLSGGAEGVQVASALRHSVLGRAAEDVRGAIADLLAADAAVVQEVRP